MVILSLKHSDFVSSCQLASRAADAAITDIDIVTAGLVPNLLGRAADAGRRLGDGPEPQHDLRVGGHDVT
jgi:hypothetical protein